MAKVRFITPKGVANYPWLNAPDFAYNSDGEYKVKMVFPNTDETQAMLAKLEEIRDSFYEEWKKNPKNKGKKANLADIGEWDEETDELKLNFKSKAQFTNKDTDEIIKIKIPLFDAKGTPVDVKIGGGSVLRIAYTPEGYYMASTKMIGVTCRIAAVKVIELKEYAGAGAGAYGFDDDEEGYVADEDNASGGGGDFDVQADEDAGGGDF